jgi:hypothetical protein
MILAKKIVKEYLGRVEGGLLTLNTPYVQHLYPTFSTFTLKKLFIIIVNPVLSSEWIILPQY